MSVVVFRGHILLSVSSLKRLMVPILHKKCTVYFVIVLRTPRKVMDMMMCVLYVVWGIEGVTYPNEITLVYF